MSWREVVGYSTLTLLIGGLIIGWWRWREAVRADRLMRWGKQVRNKRR